MSVVIRGSRKEKSERKKWKIHTYNHTYIHTYIHTNIHTYIHTYIHAYSHIHHTPHLLTRTQVSAWGGYVFILNLIALHVLVLMLCDMCDMRVYIAYCTFIALGFIMSMQVANHCIFTLCVTLVLFPFAFLLLLVRV